MTSPSVRRSAWEARRNASSVCHLIPRSPRSICETNVDLTPTSSPACTCVKPIRLRSALSALPRAAYSAAEGRSGLVTTDSTVRLSFVSIELLFGQLRIGWGCARPILLHERKRLVHAGRAYRRFGPSHHRSRTSGKDERLLAIRPVHRSQRRHSRSRNGCARESVGCRGDPARGPNDPSDGRHTAS